MIRKVKPGTVIGFTHPNRMVDKPNNYTLRLKSNTRRTLNDIIALFLQQSNTNLTPQVVKECFTGVMVTAINEVMRGNAVSLKYLNMSTAVSGIFDDPTEAFHPEKHKLKVVYSSSPEVIAAARQSSVRNMGRAVNNEVGNIVNRMNNSVNENITPGEAITITGNKIKVAGNIAGDVEGGVLFVDESTDTVAAFVGQKQLLLNTPSRLILNVPATLTPGNRYRITISTFAAVKSSKTVKTQRLLDSDFVFICL